MQEFIMIPYSLIYNRNMGDKRVLVYSSILFSGWAGKNVEELVRYSKYSPRRDSGGVLQQYKVLIKSFVENHYFKKTKNNLIYVRPEESFGIIYRKEFQIILQSRDSKLCDTRRINHSHLLLLLSHIRLCMIRSYGVPRFYSNLLSRISNNIGLSVRSISKSLKILEELEIIHSEELPRYKDNDGHWHSNVKIFVNMNPLDENIEDSYSWQNETSKGIRYIIASQLDYTGG